MPTYKTQPRKRKVRPASPKCSVIQHVASGNYCKVPADGKIPDHQIVDGYTEFPSRSQALKALAKFIPLLPPKSTPQEADLYRVKTL